MECLNESGGEKSGNKGQLVLEVGREIIEAHANGSEALAPESTDFSTHEVSPTSVRPVGFLSPNKFTFCRHQSLTSDRRCPVQRDEESRIEWLDGIVTWIVNNKVFFLWIVSLCVLGVLVAAFTIEKLKNINVWGLDFWKWCVLVIVIFGGMLVTNWLMQLVVFVTKSNSWLRKKMLYYVNGIRKIFRVFMWVGLVLVTWLLLFNHGTEGSKNSTKHLHFVTWSLVSALIGAFLWTLKTLSFKILSLRFYLHTFVGRTRESIFHQYVLKTLSGTPLMEAQDGPSKAKAGGKKNEIDIGKILKMKLEEVSAETMEVLVDAVSSSKGRLSTLNRKCKEISSEMEAIAAAKEIFHNVATPGVKHIKKRDLMRFMVENEAELAFMLFNGAETGEVYKRDLTDWVVKVYHARKGLIKSLTDTKKAVNQLDKLVTSILLVISILVWLLLVKIASAKVLVLLSSQIVLAAFIFGNTCKNVFEAVVFVFVMHPFHVGDHCIVDGIPLIVEEMNILTTVFLKLNNDKVYYPNSVLSTLPISNCKTSSCKTETDTGDVVEFSIAFAPVEKIRILEERIKQYIEKNPRYWHPNHNVAVIDIENGNKLKMGLYFDYIYKSQQFGERGRQKAISGEKTKRRSELVIELMTILQQLSLTGSVLP